MYDGNKNVKHDGLRNAWKNLEVDFLPRKTDLIYNSWSTFNEWTKVKR